MNPLRRAIFTIVPLAILLLPIAVYATDTATSSDTIARNVTIGGLPVGGLTPAEARSVLEAHQADLRASTGTFSVQGQTFELNPLSIGLTVGIDGAIDRAMDVSRSGGVLSNFTTWLRSFGTIEDVPLDIAFSAEAIDKQLDKWEKAAITNPAFEGSIVVVDGVVVAEYPQSGEAIERVGAAMAIEEAMSTLDKSPVVELPIVTSEPTLTREDIDRAVAEMERMIDDDVTLISSEVGVRVSFSPHELAEAARADLSEAGDAMVVSFDEHEVLHVIEPLRDEFERPPVNATYDVDLATNELSVIPGRPGTLIDVEALLAEMKRAALADGIGVFPLVVGAQPAFTTEQAQTYLPDLGLLGEFTTKHPAGQDRVINIQRMARDVDGAVVLPGDDWSINDEVGIRTEEKGYVAAPAIINGVPYCCDNPANIGGGVSQFGTTLFNAVFFSCLEDVEHQPHSLSFSRYPAGREATLGYPKPDVRFRNNTDYPVVIKTSFTSTSITVKMFGNNGGKECTDITYEPEDIVEAEDEFVADTEGKLKPGERVKERNGIDGFLQRVDRLVKYPDGREEVDLKLVWRYRPLSTLYTVHPCEVTGEPVDCPVPLPSVVGMTWGDALAALSDKGFLAAKNLESVDDPAKNDVVLAQKPGRGEYVAPGTTIALTVGSYTGDG